MRTIRTSDPEWATIEAMFDAVAKEFERAEVDGPTVWLREAPAFPWVVLTYKAGDFAWGAP